MKTHCLTQHYNHYRTGWNPHETKLKISNVSPVRFGRLFTQAVEGTVYAQPLYVPGLDIPGRGRHNVVLVATENDVVYAFDADKDEAPLWRHHLARPGETSVAVGDIEGCDNVAPRIGITGTPVIDLKSKTLYLVMKTKRVTGGTPNFYQYLCALDIHTGKHRHKSPREIHATAPGSGQKNDGHGHVIFLPLWQMNRPGLLLMKDIIYVGFGGHCDFHPGEYHGWVLSFHAKSLHHQATLVTSPNSSLSGIWQGGMGLAADSDHFIYFTTGNGVFNGNTGGRDYGDTVLKLNRHLVVQSSFTPADQATLLFPADVDLGSGGVLVLPDQPSSPSHPRMVVTCGKDGDIFLLDRSNLGGYSGPGGTNPQAVQSLPLQPGKPKSSQPGIWGGPAYYHGPGGQFIYYCGDGGPLTAFKLHGGLLSPATVGGGTPNKSAVVYGAGGTTPIVSSNRKIGGTGIVWAINRSNPLRLQAYDATDLTAQLYDDNAGPWNNPDGGAFIEPTVANGKVYVASDGELGIFGLK
jgi:hypothetical protein